MDIYVDTPPLLNLLLLKMIRTALAGDRFNVPCLFLESMQTILECLESVHRQQHTSTVVTQFMRCF